MRGFFIFVHTKPDLIILYKIRKMKRLFLLTAFLSLCSCSNDDSPDCSSVSNQVWFQGLKDDLDADCSIKTSIFQVVYNGQIVYYVLITDPRVNFSPRLDMLDCRGNIIVELTNDQSIEYLNGDGRDDEVIYTCSE